MLDRICTKSMAFEKMHKRTFRNPNHPKTPRLSLVGLVLAFFGVASKPSYKGYTVEGQNPFRTTFSNPWNNSPVKLANKTFWFPSHMFISWCEKLAWLAGFSNAGHGSSNPLCEVDFVRRPGGSHRCPNPKTAAFTKKQNPNTNELHLRNTQIIS